jgi:hypothetical protein
MRFLLKATIPVERGNAILHDPEFGTKMSQLLSDLKAEASYFALSNGQRCAYLIVNANDASQLPSLGEPLWHWLKADVEITPVMLPQDLQKAGPDIGAAIKKWG